LLGALDGITLGLWHSCLGEDALGLLVAGGESLGCLGEDALGLLVAGGESLGFLPGLLDGD